MITSECFLCKADDSLVKDFTAGQIACSRCGAVQEDRLIDETQEWRNFSDNSDGINNSRCGAPTQANGGKSTFSTTIHVKSKNSPLSKLSNFSLGSGPSFYMKGVTILDELSSRLDIQKNIIDKAKSFLMQLEDFKDSKRCNKNNTTIAAILYASFKQCGAYKRIKSLCQMLHLEVREVQRKYNSIKNIIQTKQTTNKIVTITQSTLEIVRQFSIKLNLPSNIIKAAEEIAESIGSIGVIEGRAPSTVASVSILHAINLFGFSKLSINDISSILSINQSTIIKAYAIVC
jgi:transcription initiation factor TFIIB